MEFFLLRKHINVCKTWVFLAQVLGRQKQECGNAVHGIHSSLVSDVLISCIWLDGVSQTAHVSVLGPLNVTHPVLEGHGFPALVLEERFPGPVLGVQCLEP